MMKKDRNHILHTICHNTHGPSIEDILLAQEQGDIMVNQILTTAIYFLAQAISFIINLNSPPMIMIDSRIFSSESNKTIFYNTLEEFLFGVNIADITFRFLPYYPMRGAHSATALVVKYGILVASDS